MSDSTSDSDYHIVELPRSNTGSDRPHPQSSDVYNPPPLNESFEHLSIAKNKLAPRSVPKSNEVDMEEDGKDSLSKLQSQTRLTQQHTKLSTPARRTRRLPTPTCFGFPIRLQPLQDEPTLPILVWNERTQQWLHPTSLSVPPLVTNAMREQIRSMTNASVLDTFLLEISASTVMSRARRAEIPKHSCFGCAVLSRDREMCSNDESGRTACDECVRRHRLCGQMCCGPPGTGLAYGFLPLPDEWREGLDCTMLQWYVREETNARAVLFKGKGRA